jgi:transposase
MRRIRQVLQLHFGSHASARVIAGTVGVGRSTVQDYLARGAAAGLAWPLSPELTDEALEQLLFPAPHSRPGARRYVEPDWSALVREMKRPGVNLSVLFEEYQGAHPAGYAYSRFCQLYRAFERRLSPTMRQTHVAGAKAFVDYSGKRVPIVDPLTGEVRMAELFVAVLGASNLTYADATWTQSLPDWIGAHVRMFRFFGSAPRLLSRTISRAGSTSPRFTTPK